MSLEVLRPVNQCHEQNVLLLETTAWWISRRNSPGSRKRYWYRSPTSAECVHDTTQRECLALVWPVLHFRPYLESTRFTIKTDQYSLKWILYLSSAYRRFARWHLRLSEFDFDVIHQAGVKHQAAEPLSRLDTDGEEKTHLDDDLPVCNIENIRVKINETPNINVWTECDTNESDLIADKPTETPSKRDR